jgi:LmbE family N-acetylglucosaminyl deacetylase
MEREAEMSTDQDQDQSQSQQRKVALAIFAHPDDPEFGCAGTIASWVREGWEIHYVIVTDASRGGLDEATDVGEAARRAITEVRKSEQRAAAAVVGASDVIFLDYPDGIVQPTLELRRDIVRLLRRFRPSRVICPSPDRVWSPHYFIARHHPDHLAVGEATLSAIYPAAQNPWDFPELLEEGLRPHKVNEIFITSPPTVNFAVDISQTIDLKIEALRAHQSQVGAHFERTEQRIREWTARNGAKHDLPFAEEFHRVLNP